MPEPDARGVDDPARAHVDLGPVQPVADRDAVHAPAGPLQDPRRAGPRDERGAMLDRRAGHGEAEARVVLDAVRVGDAAAQAGAPDGRDELSHRAPPRWWARPPSRAAPSRS